MRVVSPYRPFPAESESHKTLGPFDWEGALEMLAVSVRQSCGCDTLAITDVDTTLRVPALHFRTQARRLMLWILEVSLRYLESPAFDRDTVMISPDVLVFEDLAPWFRADLGVLVRPEAKHTERPILNQVQWWRHTAKDRLIVFFRAAVALADTLPDDLKTWGADTEPLRLLLQPLELGEVPRGDLQVSIIDCGTVLQSLNTVHLKRMVKGLPVPITRPVLDFRFKRKLYMRAAFEATFGSVVPA